MTILVRSGFLAVALLVVSPGFAADISPETYKALGIAPAKVLTGTVLSSRVMSGGGKDDKQVVSVVTYFTGKKESAEAVNVRLDVLVRSAAGLTSLYTLDLGQENGGNVGAGDLQVLDLNLDGVNEIIVSYDSFEDPLIEQRLSQVIAHRGQTFQSLWSGPVKYDATKAARSVPREQRDRFLRELDLSSTIGTRGVTLFVNKTMIAVAGERLAEPKIVQETFPLQ